MNTKFSFTLLAVLVVLLVGLAVTTSFSKAPASTTFEPSDYHQRHRELTGADDTSDYYDRHSELISAAEPAREVQAPHLWSGEVFLSDNDSPDVNIVTNQDQQSVCMSEDSLDRRYGGCVE